MFFVKDAHENNQPVIGSDLLLTYGATFRKVKNHEIIFREGSQALFFYWIEEGRVKMFNESDADKEFIQGIFDAGESFGEPPLIASQRYPASARAMGDSLLLRLSRDRFLTLLCENPSVHFQFTNMLACRLLAKSEYMMVLSNSSPETRILNLLKQNKKHCGYPDQELHMVKFTRQEIADMTGLRVETVIRTIKVLEERGILKIEHRKVLF
jgi:CRP/FNR family transcriptional regulator, cyclic AMP receptor protein